MERRRRAMPVLAVVLSLATVVLLTLAGCSTTSAASGSSQPTTGSVDATPENCTSRFVNATIASGPPCTCLISASRPFLAQSSAR